MDDGAVVVIGATSGIGRELAADYARAGSTVVISGRTAERAAKAAAEIGAATTGIAVDLAQPSSLRAALAGTGPVRRLVITANERDVNPVAEYDPLRAQELVALKLVGCVETVHVLKDRLTADASILLFGGLAKERPADGSVTASTVTAGISGMARSLACELAPIRVNAIHPGIVGDSPHWISKPLDSVVTRTPIGRLVTMAEIVQASQFLLECGGVNGTDLVVDGGWLLRLAPRTTFTVTARLAGVLGGEGT
jgi:NAD(P)-dependent dehydrogenase (short-subunit alcohol dehydrogenase family)